MSKEVIYRVKDFSFEYPFQQRGISWKGGLEICKGDFILLKGSSGSGKTTLLYTLKGLIPEQINGTLKGAIEYKGRAISQLTERDKMDSGLLFQNPAAQMIHKTVRQELAFGLENLQVQPNEISESIEKAAKEYNIEALLDRDVLTLSGGEMQKVALLSILLTDPEILLLDEPTAFLDPASAEELLAIIRNQVKNKTVIIVEHNLSYFKEYINRVIAIDDNGFLHEESPENVLWEQEFKNLHQQQKLNAILSIKDLSFSFKEKQLYKSLNLSVHKGETISITGKNGVGKSTLFKIISGLVKGYSGRIEINDMNLKALKQNELFRQIGYLFQNPENHFIFPTVMEEVGGKQELLESIGLQEHGNQNPFTLSVGEKRRLSLAIVQSLDRPLIMLDEPTFGQDYENKKKLIFMIEELKMKGHAILIISHDMPFVKAVSDRVYLLNNYVLSELE